MTNSARPGDGGHVQRFFVNQKLTAMVNRYEIRVADADGAPGEIAAFAEQKRMKLKEEVIFYRDASKTEVLFSFKSRQRIDLAAETDVLDRSGAQIGWFRKDFKKSLLRSTWHLHYGDVEAIGQESNITKAILRRFVDVPLRFDFDFVDVASGERVMNVHRVRSLRDRYDTVVDDERIDFRLATAVTVALDAFQGR